MKLNHQGFVWLLAFLSCVHDSVSACEIKAVHITVGNHFVEESNEDMYVVGFMSTTECKLATLAVEIMENKLVALQVPAFMNRSYVAPESTGVSYARFFYFFQLTKSNLKSNLCRFDYRVRADDQTSQIFGFESNFYCNHDYKIYTLGQHDDSQLGQQTIRILRDQSYDLLIMPGNYAHNLHTENGLVGDRYFEIMQPLLTKTPFLILPAQRERFDDYKMFSARFLMPSCPRLELIEGKQARNEISANCDFFHFTDTDAYYLFINFDRILTSSSNTERKTIFKQVWDLLEQVSTSDAHKNKWRVVITNVAWFCSSELLKEKCAATLYALKEFDDLFEKYGVHLMVNSAKKYYESIKNVFNFDIRNSNSRLTITVGISGCKNFFIIPEFTKKDFSRAVVKETQGILLLDFFTNYYKADLLDIPSILSVDMNYVEKNNQGFQWFLAIFTSLILLVVILALEFIPSETIGKKITGEKLNDQQTRHQEELLGHKSS